MIDYTNNRIIHGDKEEEIIKWTCWFRTPVGGLYVNVQDALKSLEKISGQDVDPQMLIFPVPVALSSTLYEEVIRGR